MAAADELRAYVGYRRQGRPAAPVDQAARLRAWKLENEAANAQHLQDLSSMGYVAGGEDPAVRQRAQEHVAGGMNVGGLTAFHGAPKVFNRFTNPTGSTHSLTESRSFAEALARSEADNPRGWKIAGEPFDPRDPSHLAAQRLVQSKGDVKDAIAKTAAELDNVAPAVGEDSRSVLRLRATIDALRNRVPQVTDRPAPHLYTVDIPDPSVANMMSMDKPMREQMHVINALRKDPNAASTIGAMDTLGQFTGNYGTPEALLKGITMAHGGSGRMRGMAGYQALSDAGIPGMVEQSAMSRFPPGSGYDNNFRVFPEHQGILRIQDIEPLERY
jgi:hypothetical protein